MIDPEKYPALWMYLSFGGSQEQEAVALDAYAAKYGSPFEDDDLSVCEQRCLAELADLIREKQAEALETEAERHLRRCAASLRTEAGPGTAPPEPYEPSAEAKR